MSDRIEYQVFVDWDYQNLLGNFDFSQSYDNISADVRNRVVISRTKGEVGNLYPAATAEFVVNNTSGRYFMHNTNSDLYGKIRLYLPVRIVMSYRGLSVVRFTGFINRIVWRPHANEQSVYFYCTDGIDLLTKCIVIQDMDNRVAMTDGDAVSAVLDAAGWCTTRRAIDGTGDEIMSMPDTFDFPS